MKRAEIGELVCRGAESVGYKGLATFEFLRDSSGDFYFRSQSTCPSRAYSSELMRDTI